MSIGVLQANDLGGTSQDFVCLRLLMCALGRHRSVGPLRARTGTYCSGSGGFCVTKTLTSRLTRPLLLIQSLSLREGNGLIKNGVIHRGSQVKKGWRRAEVVVPRKRLLGRQARARECRSGAGRPGAAGTGWREAGHLAAGGSRDAPTRTYPGVRVPPSSWRRGGRPAGEVKPVCY